MAETGSLNASKNIYDGCDSSYWQEWNILCMYIPTGMSNIKIN
jgi:hypothetical protein